MVGSYRSPVACQLKEVAAQLRRNPWMHENRAIPFSAGGKNSRGITSKVVAFGGEASVSVVGHLARERQDTMTLYIIRGATVSAHAAPPAAISEGEVIVGSAAELAASALSKNEFGGDLE